MLEIKNLTKVYPTFRLDDVSFRLEKGKIMGFIGANGAGKTTTLKCILNIANPDSGSISILGKDMQYDEISIKKEVGFMLGEIDYYTKTKVGVVGNVYKRFFDNWDDGVYKKYLQKFNIDESKKIGELSTGMRVKLSIAFALSHNAKLLIFDEPTSGLDPVAREEITDVFREIANEGKSILFSTHITSDLDRCADNVTYLRRGKIVFSEKKEDIINKYSLVQISKDMLDKVSEDKVIGIKNNAFGATALIETTNRKDFEGCTFATPDLEDIMVYLEGEQL